MLSLKIILGHNWRKLSSNPNCLIVQHRVNSAQLRVNAIKSRFTVILTHPMTQRYWSWLAECFAGATSRRASSRARTTSRNMRVRRFVFKTVVSSCRSSDTHFKMFKFILKWKEKALNCLKNT